MMDDLQALRSHRSHEQWSWELLDTNDNFLGDFPGVTGGSLTYNVNADIRTGGKLVWKGIEPPTWLGIRVRPVYSALLLNGTQIRWPFGVYIPTTPEPDYNGMYQTADVEFYDKTSVLRDDAVDTTYALPAGTVVTTAIRALIESAGETKITILDSAATLVNPYVAEVGTSKLRIVNDLLEIINYFSIHVDNAGYFRAEPYVEPSKRGSMWDFSDGEASIYQPRWKHKQDYYGKPNKVILISAGSGDTAAFKSVATNTNPLDPLAYGGLRGDNWVTVTETGIEADSQATLDGLAQRRLTSLAEVSSTFNLKHALIQLDLNGLVTFRNDAEGISVKGVVQEMEFPCNTGSSTQVSTVIREVK